MVGGDFNIIRNPSEKNNDRYNSRWPLLFNACIETLNLRELELSGRKFTWANSAEHPTFERLDRILVSTDWEQKFSLSTVEALTREISDHTPLLLDTNQASHRGNTPLFKFELGWLAKDGFFDLITNVWKAENRGTSPLQRWQNKIRTVRRYLRGWAKNQVGQNKTKSFLLQQLDILDRKAESTLLSPQELEHKRVLSVELSGLLREEELYWFQRSKATRLLQGDANTRYFQLVANGRHRKTRIFQLEQDEGTIVGHDNLKTYITEYYKNLFGEPEQNDFSLNEDTTEDIPQVSRIENEFLCDEFSEKEIRDAVFQMEHNKAPGPDGFPAEFYQFFWETIKAYLIQLFVEFHRGELPLHSLNFGVITLLPKKEDATKVQQYRPICLLNVSFKIFTKVLTNRLSVVAQKIIRPSQTAFIPGRHIL